MYDETLLLEKLEQMIGVENGGTSGHSKIPTPHIEPCYPRVPLSRIPNPPLKGENYG